MPLYRGEYDDVLLPFTDGMAMKMMNSKRYHGQRKWEKDSAIALLEALEAEVAELREAIADGSPIEGILECYDVANMAMMVADRLGAPRLVAPVLSQVATSLGHPPCVHGYATASYCPSCQQERIS